MALGDPVCNPVAFRAEARWQRVCALCGKGGGFHAHHVVDVQRLRRLGVVGNALYDTRNALRLCEGLDTRRCHLNFENRVIAIPTRRLRDENVEYAFEALGSYAADFLRSEYDDRDPDPRITELEKEDLWTPRTVQLSKTWSPARASHR